MSETVQLAIVSMVQSWGIAFIEQGPVWLAGLTSFIVGVGGWWISRKVTAQHKNIVQQVCEVKDVAVRSKEEAELQIKGAERKNVELGIQTERLRASENAALTASYKPESTDVFMARLEPK